MKNSKLIILFSVIFCVHLSCNERPSSEKNNVEVKRLNEFPAEYSIAAKSPNVEDTMLRITDIFVMDTLLICYDIYNKWDKMLKIYHFETFEVLGEFGVKGRGPKEISSPGYPAINRDNNSLVIEDNGKDKMYQLKFDSIINNNRYFPVATGVSPKKFRGAVCKEVVNDTMIFASQLHKEDLIFSHINGDFIKKVGVPFINDNSYNDFGFFELVAHKFCVNRLKKRIAVFYQYQDRVSYFNINGEELFDVWGPDYLEPKIGFVNNNRNYKYKYSEEMAYHSGTCNNQYVYLTYSGERKAEKKKGGGYKLNYPNSIHVLNWNGEPVVKLKLDRPISEIAIDSKNNQLIATDPLGYVPFVLYDLSKIDELKL